MTSHEMRNLRLSSATAHVRPCGLSGLRRPFSQVSSL
jgi:hypothetical protein